MILNCAIRHRERPFVPLVWQPIIPGPPNKAKKKESVEFHRLLPWNKLAEICSQLLFKGRKIYVEGRLQTRQWEGQDGASRQTTEIVITDMIILDSRREQEEGGEAAAGEEKTPTVIPEETAPKEETKEKESKGKNPSEEEVKAEDIPF